MSGSLMEYGAVRLEFYLVQHWDNITNTGVSKWFTTKSRADKYVRDMGIADRAHYHLIITKKKKLSHLVCNLLNMRDAKSMETCIDSVMSMDDPDRNDWVQRLRDTPLTPDVITSFGSGVDA